MSSDENFPNSSETENLAQKDSFESFSFQENITKESSENETGASSSQHNLKKESPTYRAGWSSETPSEINLAESGVNPSLPFENSSESDAILAEPVFEDNPKLGKANPMSPRPRFFTKDKNILADYSYDKEVQTLAASELREKAALFVKRFIRNEFEQVGFDNNLRMAIKTIKELTNNQKTSRSGIRQAVLEVVDNDITAKDAGEMVFEAWEKAFDTVYGYLENKVGAESPSVQDKVAVVEDFSPQIKLFEKSLKMRNVFNTLNSIEKNLIAIFERETGDIANEKEFFEARAGAKNCDELISSGHLKIEDVASILMWIATYKKGTKVSLKSVSEHYKTYYLQQKAPNPYLSQSEKNAKMLKERNYEEIIDDVKKIARNFLK